VRIPRGPNQMTPTRFHLNKERLRQFLSHDAMRKRSLCCRPRCSSVCHVGAMYLNGAEDFIKLRCRPGSPIILVFLTSRAMVSNSKGNPFSRRAKCTGSSGKIWRFSTKSPFISQTVRDRCYGTLIGSHRWRGSIRVGSDDLE